MFFIQFLLSFFQTNDILALPMSINAKKHFILGRALFLHTIKHLDDLEFHLRLFPEYQQKRLNLKQWFNLKLQLTFGVITMILRESKLRGELIDNRIRHCYNGEVMNRINGGGAL